MASSNATSPGFVPLLSPYSGLAQQNAQQQQALAAQAQDNVGNFIGSADSLISAGKGAYDLYSWLSGSGSDAATGLTQGFASGAEQAFGGGFTGLEGGLDLSGTNFLSDLGTGASEATSGIGSISKAFDGIGLTDFDFSSVGSGLASAGVGMAAGFAGRTVGGWLGAKGPGADIGSTIGGAIGSYVGGPLGTFVGSTLGSVVGGLFGGGGTPHPHTGFGNYGINADGTFKTEGAWSGAKHSSVDYANAMSNSFSKYLQQQAKKYGIQYDPNVITGITGGAEVGAGNYMALADKEGYLAVSRDPDFSKWYGAGKTYPRANEKPDLVNFYYFDPKDNSSRDQAFEDAFKGILSSSGIDYASLTPVNANATEIKIPRVTGPSDWDNFLANYRAQHEPQSTATA